MNDTTTQTQFIPNRRQRRTAMAHQGLLKQRVNLVQLNGINFAVKLKLKVTKSMKQILKEMKNLILQDQKKLNQLIFLIGKKRAILIKKQNS